MKVTQPLLFLTLGAANAASGNMNGRYFVASGGKQKVQFNDDYASKGYEYFDVWAPEIATHYGEVFWTDQGNLPLPPDIIKRFAGKTMAIMGYEQDQVMVVPTGKPGANPEKDVSVPINWAYNHHYMAWMTGNFSVRKQVLADKDDTMAHGSKTKFVCEDTPDASKYAIPDIPTSQMFSEGNGGESRKSYHGYPAGFAQLIQSPQTWHITPMQIDTRNRDCGADIASIGNCTRFTPGPEPKQARYGFGIPTNTNYSGILECPCNSRFGGDPIFYPNAGTKIVKHDYAAVAAPQCKAGEVIRTADECFAAAQSSLGLANIRNATVTSKTLPPGCSASTAGGVTTVSFNSLATSTGTCAAGSIMSAGAVSVIQVAINVTVDKTKGPTAFARSAKGVYCADNHVGVLKEFPMATTGAAEAQKQLTACETFCAASDKCGACSVDCPHGLAQCQWAAIPSCGRQQTWAGLIPGDVSLKSQGQATITVSGPSSVWFGVGFNAKAMADAPYTLIVNSSGVTERQIGTCGSEAEHCPGDVLASSVTVVSNTVTGGRRTVVMTRPANGQTAKHYTFNPGLQDTIPFITAVGSSQTFAVHVAHGPGTMTFLPQDGQAVCVCDTGANGQLCETNNTQCQSFVKTCLSETQGGDLLAQQNPTCNSRQYSGGLKCCHHGRIMLDDDQEVRPELLRYHMKFRFWFQEFKPASDTTSASHRNLPRIYQQTEANAGEYDIPPAFARPGLRIPGYPDWPEGKMTPGTTCTGSCPDGPDCECIHTITYRWTVGQMRLIYAGGHCHAPACKSLILYRNDTGHEMEMLCAQIPLYGSGAIHVDKYDEAGYAAIPPCLWGDDEGLEPSVLLPNGTPLVSIKENYNTRSGHYGEMASWQMRGVSD